VTRDHSLVAELIASGEITPEEARVHPQRNVILRALGLEQQVKVDISSIKLDPGDRFLLASDGLTGMVTDEEIERVMRGAMEPMEAARALVASALDEGGVDNVSVVVVFFDRSESFVQASPLKGGGGERTDEGTAGEPSAGRSKRRMWIWLTVLALVVVILGAAAGVTYYLYNRSYYVGAKGGAVVLYRGFPFWGLAKVDGSVTGPKVALLGDESQQRLEEGMDVESHEEALAHIERLSAEAKKNTRVVPDVREIQVSDAQVAIEKSGLVPRKRWEAPPQSGKPVSENVVKRQEPKPYSEVRKGSAVYIYVYRPAKIPGEKVKGG